MFCLVMFHETSLIRLATQEHSEVFYLIPIGPLPSSEENNTGEEQGKGGVIYLEDYEEVMRWSLAGVQYSSPPSIL